MSILLCEKGGRSAWVKDRGNVSGVGAEQTLEATLGPARMQTRFGSPFNDFVGASIRLTLGLHFNQKNTVLSDNEGREGAYVGIEVYRGL
jgi:hypothetical protein